MKETKEQDKSKPRTENLEGERGEAEGAGVGGGQRPPTCIGHFARLLEGKFRACVCVCGRCDGQGFRFAEGKGRYYGGRSVGRSAGRQVECSG